MAKLRIGVLYDYWWDEDEEQAEGERPKKKSPEEDVQQVYEALKKGGHNPVYVRLDGTRESLIELAQSQTDLLFNLVESFAGDDSQDTNVAGYLELLGRRFTGAGSTGLHLAQDKNLAKKIFTFHGIHTPYFTTVYRGRIEHSHDIQFPVIVKPAREDGSIGIQFGAVCSSIKELMERIDYIHAEFDSPALIEEYIEGRELYVECSATRSRRRSRWWSWTSRSCPRGRPRSPAARSSGRRTAPPTRRPSRSSPRTWTRRWSRLQETAVQAFTALQLRDYGRIDFRLATDNTIHVLEVNPNPYLLSSAELSMAAKKSGRSYDALIAEIVDSAMGRYATAG